MNGKDATTAYYECAVLAILPGKGAIMTTLIGLTAQIRTFVQEPQSIKKYDCKELILVDLKRNIGVSVGMGALRTDCKVYCHDYNAENFNAALNDLMKANAIKMEGMNSFMVV